MLNSYLYFHRNAGEPIEVILPIALAEYSERFPNSAPDSCYINPQQGSEGELLGIRIKHTNALTPGHCWLGVDILL